MFFLEGGLVLVYTTLCTKTCPQQRAGTQQLRVEWMRRKCQLSSSWQEPGSIITLQHSVPLTTAMQEGVFIHWTKSKRGLWSRCPVLCSGWHTVGVCTAMQQQVLLYSGPSTLRGYSEVCRLTLVLSVSRSHGSTLFTESGEFSCLIVYLRLVEEPHWGSVISSHNFSLLPV